MQADLAAPVREAQWIVNSYMLLLGALILVGGAAGDRFGRRRTFVIGVLVFTAASVACGFAPNAAALIAARAVQGAGAALLVPTQSRDHQRRVSGKGARARHRHVGGCFGADDGARPGARRLARPTRGRGARSSSSTCRLRHSRSRSRCGTCRRATIRTRARALDWTGGVLAVVGLGSLTYGLTLASDAGLERSESDCRVDRRRSRARRRSSGSKVARARR